MSQDTINFLQFLVFAFIYCGIGTPVGIFAYRVAKVTNPTDTTPALFAGLLLWPAVLWITLGFYIGARRAHKPAFPDLMERENAVLRGMEELRIQELEDNLRHAQDLMHDRRMREINAGASLTPDPVMTIIQTPHQS